MSARRFVRSADGRLVVLGWFATVVPVWVAAWRVAASGFHPTGDAALTVLRARDVFSAQIPLVGMPAASATDGGVISHFPGPLQLYALAGPVQLFGNVWGPPIAMAGLATLWITLTAWVLYRSVGTRSALAGFALLGVFAWSIGVGYLVDPVPLMMIVFPLPALLLVAWCATSGEPIALVGTAIIGMYLWLDHLVFVILVPPVMVCALVGYILAHRGAWRASSTDDPLARRRARRGLIGAAVATVTMWLPTLFAEATTSPGNLQRLLTSSGAEREVIASWTFSFHVVIGLIAWPPFWLRGSFANPPFHNQPGSPGFAGAPTAFDLVAGAVLAAVFVTLAVLARRRGDRLGVWVLVTAAVAGAATIPTIYFTPTRFGVAGYLRPLWGVAAFVWFAILFVTFRLLAALPLGERVRAPALWVSTAVVVVFGVLNLPTGTTGYVPNDDVAGTVRIMNREVLDVVHGRGPIALRTRPDYETQAYFSALILAFKTAGIDFCVASGSPPIEGVPPCDDRARDVFDVRVVRHGSEPEDTILDLPTLGAHDLEQLERLEARVVAWLTGGDPIELSATARREVAAITDADQRRAVDELLGATDDLEPLPERLTTLGALVGVWFNMLGHTDEALFVASPLAIDEWRQWQALRAENRTLVVVDTGTTTN